jgi:hypothetical protein
MIALTTATVAAVIIAAGKRDRCGWYAPLAIWRPAGFIVALMGWILSATLGTPLPADVLG